MTLLDHLNSTSHRYYLIFSNHLFDYRWNRTFHAYHSICTYCGIELRHDSREVKGDLYYLKCHDQMNIPICGGCRRPIEERIVTALGKKWHVDHFVCSHCERPFLGKNILKTRWAIYILFLIQLFDLYQLLLIKFTYIYNSCKLPLLKIVMLLDIFIICNLLLMLWFLRGIEVYPLNKEQSLPFSYLSLISSKCFSVVSHYGRLRWINYIKGSISCV